jgi:hypothetical protein
MNKLNVEKRRDKDWPTGKTHKAMSALIREFEPEDTMAEMEMEQALPKMKLGPKKDPSKTQQTCINQMQVLFRTQCLIKEESTSVALRGVITFKHHCDNKHDLLQKEQNFNL